MKSVYYQIFVINPGSTSTKLALFINEKIIEQETIQHSFTSQQSSSSMWLQFEERYAAAKNFLEKNNVNHLNAVVGRGGLLKPLRRGIYKVNETLITDARKGVQGEHASNMGGVLAAKVAEIFNTAAYVVDPVSVDEFEPLARYSGHPLIERKSLSHALSIRASALWAAQKIGVSIKKSRFIVGHLGGGISIAAVKAGRIIDVNDASSAGPFSPERSGSLPMQQFIELCFSEKYSKNEIKKMIMGAGGLSAYLGTASLLDVESRIKDGDKKADEVFQAMVYQIAKEISAMAAVLSGQLDAIVLTGGLANSKQLISTVKRRISFLAPVIIFKGELEMEAMAFGALRVLTGEEKAKSYK